MNGKCDSCDSKVKLAKCKVTVDPTYNAGKHTRDVELCNICLNTASGKATRYPSQEITNQELLYAICKIGNMIMQEIKKNKKR